EPGYPPAHGWMASHELAHWSGSPAQAEALLNDLEVAEQKWAGFPSALAVRYAQLLYQFSRGDEALVMLRRRAADDPMLNVAYGELEAKLEEADDIRFAVSSGRESLTQRIHQGNASVADMTQLVRLELLAENWDRAVANARDLLRTAPSSPDLRR